MKYEKSCGAVIFDGDRVLVIQQVKGHWGFPKGHVEPGETEGETAIREIKEETNLDVEINEKYRYVERYSPEEGIEKDVIFFIAKKTGGEIKVQEEEVTATEWLLPEDAIEKVTYDSSKRILEKVIKDLGV
jgi:8-oxo-dGTP pyrophosphatase MutT (NUDIX family)